MTGRKRVAALLLCIGMILVCSLSTAFVIYEADHDCAGEDCPICWNIATIIFLRTAGLAALALPVCFLLRIARVLHSQRDPYVFFCPATLVSWKIRLND